MIFETSLTIFHRYSGDTVEDVLEQRFDRSIFDRTLFGANQRTSTIFGLQRFECCKLRQPEYPSLPKASLLGWGLVDHLMAHIGQSTVVLKAAAQLPITL